jgi:hypothetical protein
MRRTATVHIASSLDVRPGADPPAVAAKYSANYQAMFRGYQRFFA